MNSHNAKLTHATHARNCWPAKRAQFLVYIYIYIYISWPTIDTAEYVTYRPLILKMLVYQPEMVKIYPSFHHYIQKVSEYNASTILIFKSVIQLVIIRF